MKAKKFTAVLLSALLLLTGCTTIFGEKEERTYEKITKEEAMGKTNEKELEEVVEQEEEAHYPLEIKDDQENSLHMDKKPTRIVTLSEFFNEALMALDEESRIVASPETELFSVENSLDFHSQTLVEDIKALNPDLVLVGQGEEKEKLEELKEEGLPVFYLESESLEGMLEDLETLGNLMNRTERGTRLVEDYKGLMASGEGENPKKIFVALDENPLLSAGEGTFVDSLITAAGAKNVVEKQKGYVEVGEGIVAREEIDLYVFVTDSENQEEVEELMQEYEKVDSSNIKQFYVMEIENYQMPSFVYFDRLEEIQRLLMD